MQWNTDMDAAPRDGTPHVRGLWVHNNAHDLHFWQADSGFIDEAGDFVGWHGEDFGWRASDYTHWCPLPEPPKESQ